MRKSKGEEEREGREMKGVFLGFVFYERDGKDERKGKEISEEGEMFLGFLFTKEEEEKK